MRKNNEEQTQLNRRVQELEALYEIGKVLTSELNIERVLKLILQKALELTKSNYGTLGMLNKEGVELTYDVILPEEVHTLPQKVGEGITGSVAETKEPILVSDVTKDPTYKEVFPNTKSELAVPMILQGELIGVLNVESPKIGAFDGNDQRLLEGLASYAAIAIQNAEKLGQRIKELETLQHIDETISSVLNLDEVLNLILNEGVALIKKKHKYIKIYAMIQLIDKATGDLVIKADIGVPPEKKNERAKIGGTGITGLVAKKKESLLIPDVTKECWKEWYVEMIPWVRAELAVPLLLGEGKELIGIFNLESPKIGAFDEDDKRLIESLSQQAVIAIQNAEQYETLLATYEVGKGIASSLEIKEVLGLLLDKGMKKVGAHSGSARLLDEEGENLVPCVRGGKEGQIAWGPIKIGEGIVGAAAKDKETIRVPDVRKDPRYKLSLKETQSELAVPILSPKEELIGALNFEHPLLDAFDENDMKFIKLLAAQSAIAIQNARYCQELKDTQEQLAAAKSLAWLGIVGAHWKHDVIQKAHAIRVAVDTLKLNIPKETFLERLDKIDREAELIMKVAPDLPHEDVKEVVSIDEVINTAIKKCEIPQEIKVHLQSPSRGLTPIMANNAWLSVALEHIIKNAIREMPEGGELNVTCKEEGGKILVEIGDTGCGIPEEIKSQYGKKEVTGAKGKGVGVLLTKTIFLRYGGNIELKSTGPEGTTVKLWLPIKRSAG